MSRIMGAPEYSSAVTAGAQHRVEVLARHGQRAPAVEHDLDRDAGPATLGQRVRDHPAHVARPPSSTPHR
jgi:hypothetical protein